LQQQQPQTAKNDHTNADHSSQNEGVREREMLFNVVVVMLLLQHKEYRGKQASTLKNFFLSHNELLLVVLFVV